MYNFIRTNILGTEKDQISQEQFVQDSKRFHGARATQYVNEYQQDRRWKSNFILVEVIAQGYDIKRFLEALCAQKSKTLSLLH